MTQVLRVLIVDDDASVCEALKAVLMSEGHSVLITQTASEALSQLTSFQPELAIIDFNLPGGNLSAAMRKVRPELRIILHTGSDPKELGEAAASADLVIQKGSVLTFLSKLRAFLGP